MAAETPSIVVLPLDNVSGVPDVPLEVSVRLAKAIEAKGWRVAPVADVEPLLEQERVRYLDAIDDAVRDKIIAATGAKAIVSGTLYLYADGRNPTVAVSARMVRADGTLAWADAAELSADDGVQLCGFGRKANAAEVRDEAVEQLTKRFPRAGEETGVVAGHSKPWLMRGPASFRVADLDPSTPHKVCVLPFENDASVPEAARVVADLLAIRLAAANGFEVVDPARLRAAALDAHIGSFRSISSEDLQRLAAAVGTTLFIRGTVFDYLDAAGRPGVESRVDVELSLVDVQSGRVLWTVQHERKGNDYVGFLMLGAVTNAVSLTDRVVSEMIAAGERGARHGAEKTARAAGKRPPEKRSALRGPRTEGEK